MSNDEAEKSFEDILARIEVIAGELESGEVGLEQALALFEEGVRLSKAGTGKLDRAQRKLEILLEGEQTAPFVPEDGTKP